MPQTIRFHLDETCRIALAKGLRLRGIDVTTTPDAGLLGVVDPVHDDVGRITHSGWFPCPGLYGRQCPLSIVKSTAAGGIIWV